MDLPNKYKKLIEPKKFPGFPREPASNYWAYPRVVNGWWHKLTGSEQKVLDYILRHTWGYKKDADAISLTQFETGIYSRKEHKWIDRGTGLSRHTVIKALGGLSKKGFINEEKKDGKTTVYKLVTTS